MSRQIVRCDWCGWIGYEDEFENHSKDPSCHKLDSMSGEVDYWCTFSQRQIEKLWKLLEDKPFDEDEDGRLVLCEDWFGFPAGTDREEIWHWFDENYNDGVAALLYEKEK